MQKYGQLCRIQELTQSINSSNDWLVNVHGEQNVETTAFATGLVPRVVKVAPACAVMISTYEYGKTAFSKYNKEHNRTTKSLQVPVNQ